jgi:putative transposase
MQYGCQQVLLHLDKDTQAILEYLCSESNKIFNCAVYYARQIYFKTWRIVGRAEICSEMARTKNRHFGAIYVSAAQQTCNSVAEAMRSFREITKLWKRGELAEKPKLPKYRKPGFFVVSYPKRWLKLIDGFIRVPLGNQVKAWFGIDSVLIPMPSNLDWGSIKEVRILPRNGCFYAEFVYPAEPKTVQLDPGKVLGIDHGIDNWLTAVKWGILSRCTSGFISAGSIGRTTRRSMSY